MSEFGLRIKNIEAGSLYECNIGVRDGYDATDAMFHNSLFSDFIKKNGLSSWKDESTRDIVCLNFSYGSKSYEESVAKIHSLIENATDEEYISRLNLALKKANGYKHLYVKKSAEDIRKEYYENGVHINYISKDKNGNILKTQTIFYKMLYRSTAKAKLGQVMFINAKLYNKAHEWLTMGICNLIGNGNAKIVELSAYAPLTTSTIVDRIHIPIDNVVILSDQDSFFNTIAKVVKSEKYEVKKRIIDSEKTEFNKQKAIQNACFNENGEPQYRKRYKIISELHNKCVVDTEKVGVKNTLWDGMALIENSYLPSSINGMVLLRNHFFKTCAFKTNIQLFFKDWCEKTGNDYESYMITDMFGIRHYIKDIIMLTTDNAIKWKKFSNLIGNNLNEAYMYWRKRIDGDGSIFGVVKTDHPSKLGSVQQMSYQMVNTLPCGKDEIRELAKTSIDYVELIKENNDEFEKFLRFNANAINHYEMMADLYAQNKDFANTRWFRYEKSQIIKAYVKRLRKGKITINGDNLTACGNPYALLLYSVGEKWENDPTLNFENGTIQCYTTRFDDGEYLCAIRNPHNSPNNISYLHNMYSPEMKKYFPFSDNIIAVNCIMSDIQDRMNGMDFDSDFMFVSNNHVMVTNAKKCYSEFPTIVNSLNESGITYENTLAAYADMDNKLAKSRIGIGLSSNLAQVAMTYYWTNHNNELYDNFVILSVLAQVLIDGCKRSYEVDGMEEIDRISKLECMTMVKEINDNGNVKYTKYDLPKFMKYTKEPSYTKNGNPLSFDKIKKDKEKLNSRINPSLECPMNWLEEIIDEIKPISSTNTVPTEQFFIKMHGKANAHQMSKIVRLISLYDTFVEINHQDAEKVLEKFDEILIALSKIKIGNIITINRLIETALGLEKNNNNVHFKYKSNVKYCRKLLNALYRTNKQKFMVNFIENY